MSHLRFLQLLQLRLPSLQAGVLAGGMALWLILGMATWLAVDHDYHQEVDDILRDSDRTARQLAVRTSEVFDHVNQSTQMVKFMVERQQLPPLHELRNGGVLTDDASRVVYVADARGFVTDSTSHLIPLNIADEDQFKAHKSNDRLDIRIGVATNNPLSGGWGIPVTRRLGLPDGAFGGVVTASIDPAALSGGYASSEAPDSAIGVVGLDGIYRSRLLNGKVSFGEKIDVVQLQQRAGEIVTSHQPLVSRIDGVRRFVSVVRVERYPLLAVVAVDANTSLAAYRNARTHIIGWAASVAALVLVGMSLLWLKIDALQRSRERTRQTEAALRATVEGSMDAVTMMSAVRDTQGRLLDMRLTDGNANVGLLIGAPQASLPGRSLSALVGVDASAELLTHVSSAIGSGRVLQVELATRLPAVGERWLHHQIVPMGDGVALITRDITTKRQAEQALLNMARLDALTQLGNRRDFEERLVSAGTRALRNRQALVLMFIDLDGFKAVNDNLGHATGDKLLVSVARRLQACVRGNDAVNRLGGDEFTVLLEDAGSEEDVRAVHERMLASLSMPHRMDGNDVVATPSIGVARLGDGESLDSLQQRADSAMYEAKRAGKARVVLALASGANAGLSMVGPSTRDAMAA